ncbi:FAD-binding protein, partial [Streptomyces sp. SID6013]|nr:FAD-binding protein [Streptomyces sp. SID6013]
MSEPADLVVVGAGPAGMAATAAALAGGLRVVLVDSGTA